MKTGKITDIRTTPRGRFLDIQVRENGKVVTYSVQSNADIEQGQVLEVPNNARVVAEVYL